jgi:hypothetical protein
MAKVKWRKRMVRKPSKIGKHMSFNDLEAMLSSIDVDMPTKEKIIVLLHEKRLEIDKEVEDYLSNKPTSGFLNFFSDMNPCWRLAKYQLTREGHPHFSYRGKNCGERIICDDELGEDCGLILDKLREIEIPFFWSRSRVQKKNPRATTIEDMALALNKEKD